MNIDLYICEKDLYRFGNSGSSRLANVRPHEISTVSVNGIEIIVANHSGVSVFDKHGLNETHLSGWV